MCRYGILEYPDGYKVCLRNNIHKVYSISPLSKTDVIRQLKLLIWHDKRAKDLRFY
jgi:hypothetical protein